MSESEETLREVLGGLERSRLVERELCVQFFEASLDLMGVIDFQGRFRQVNPAVEHQFGYDANELRERTFQEVVAPEHAEHVDEQLACVVDQEAAVIFEARMVTHGGQGRWIQWKMSASHDDRLIYATGRDITERRESQEQLLELNQELRTTCDQALEASRAKNTFLANMSHDLRSPLNAIIGYSELLIDEMSDGDSQSVVHDLERILAAGERLLSLVQQVLELSKIEAVQTPGHLQTLEATPCSPKPTAHKKLAGLLETYSQGDVLVVEDDDDSRELVSRLLRGAGFSVVETTNGREGLEALDHFTPKLVLLDLMMPEVDGFEFLRRFRQRAEFDKTPVVVLTAKHLTSQDYDSLHGQVEEILRKGGSGHTGLVQDVLAMVEKLVSS